MAIRRAAWNEDYWNYNAVLPYGLRTEEIKQAVEDLYNFFNRVNGILLGQEGLAFLEHLILGNTLSGMMSEFLVKRISAHSATVERNILVGGHPDLIPRGMYPFGRILRGEEGIEIKTSKQPGGWQAHNPEKCWLLVFRYIMEEEPEGKNQEELLPITFVQVLGAQLEENDWSLAERGETSRRTRTVSINGGGVAKLRSNPIYQDPNYVVADTAQRRAFYRSLNGNFRRRP